MWYNNLRTILFSLLIFLFIISCSKKNKIEEIKNYPFISGIESSKKILSGDEIETPNNGNMKIEIDKERKIYLNKNTKIKINFEKEGFAVENVTIQLISGEIIAVCTSETNSISVTANNATIIGKKTTFGVLHSTKQKMLLVRSYKGKTDLYPFNNSPTVLNACEKSIIREDGKMGQIIPVEPHDLEYVKSWINDDIIPNKVCSEIEEEIVEDLPPVWSSKPKKDAIINKPFIDVAVATDPEKLTVKYFLEKAPVGMSINSESGKIKYNNPKSGTFKVILVAEDPAGNSSKKTYYITVPGKLQAVIEAPGVVLVNSQLTVDASQSRNGMGKKSGLLYHFKIKQSKNSALIFEQKFKNNSKLNYKFKSVGIKIVTLEIKDKNGNVAQSEAQINVIVPISAALSHLPKNGTVGTEFTLTVKSKSDNISFRWDLNGDKKWDYPSDGSSTDEKIITNIWESLGNKKINVEVSDGNQRIIISDVIEIYGGTIIDSITAPDTVSVNEEVAIKCYAHDSKNKIIEYAWDFAGVGIFDRKSSSSLTKTVYKKSGIYTLICAVTNKNGVSVSDMKQIVVINSEGTVAAGGPYSTTINNKVVLKGLGRDPDNKIVEYIWKIGTTGKILKSSPASSIAEVVFSKAGDHNVIFGVKTDDGKIVYDTSFVKVLNRAPVASAGEDIVSKSGKKVKLLGRGTDLDNNIVKYEWDFDGDGKFDYSSPDTLEVKHKFEEYSYAVFRVTDGEGEIGIDTIRIIICPDGMVTNEDKKYCIDKYEYPNIKNRLPLSSVTLKEAVAKCDSLGKRLCSIDELKSECNSNNDKLAYPYGRKYEPYLCNTLGNRHSKNRKSKSGAFASCVTEKGVYDMSGNLSEWSSKRDGKNGYAVGGWWQGGEKQVGCGKFVKLNANSKYKHVGFRCCK